VNPITDEEIEVAGISLRQPTGTVETICEHLRVIRNMAKDIKDDKLREGIFGECLIATVYARRMHAKLQQYHNKVVG
jgi:hypothetical protein